MMFFFQVQSSGQVVTEKDLFSIFLKTGNQSLASRLEIERGYSFKVFSRDDFLKVLECYQGGNAIVLDFRQRLTEMNEGYQEFRSWKKLKTDNWTWDAWQGLFMESEGQLFDIEQGDSLLWGWDYVHNPSGRFLGFWWWIKGMPEDCDVKLQLEYDKLCL